MCVSVSFSMGRRCCPLQWAGKDVFDDVRKQAEHDGLVPGPLLRTSRTAEVPPAAWSGPVRCDPKCSSTKIIIWIILDVRMNERFVRWRWMESSDRGKVLQSQFGFNAPINWNKQIGRFLSFFHSFFKK